MLNGLPVVFCMDRAGYVGDDGAVHHGFMDQAFLRPLPGMVLMAPSDEAELNRCAAARRCRSTRASALRYPRDNVPACNFEDVIDEPLRGAASQRVDKSARAASLREGADATLIVYGALAQNAMIAAEELAAEGISVEVIDARFCKPLDGEMLARVLRAGHPVLTVEDHALQNGFGTRRPRVRRRPRPADRAHHAPRHARPPDRPRDAQGAAHRGRPGPRRHR